MWQSVKISNVFNTLTLKQIFWKTKAFFKELECSFLLKPLRLKTHHFHLKLLCQKQMLWQTERRLQNGPITKSGILPVTIFFLLLKICSSFGISLKQLIWCTNDANVHIRIFCKRWSLILGCFLPVSILKQTFSYFHL